MEKEGRNYRGLGNVTKDNITYIVSLDITKQRLVLIDCTVGSATFGTLCKRIDITPIRCLEDSKTKCRFLTVLPSKEEVLVTSLMLNKIYAINLRTETIQTLGPFWNPNEKDPEKCFDIKEPSGIAVDPTNGMIFVASTQKRSVEVLAPNFTYMGSLVSDPKINPLDMIIEDRQLFVANAEKKCITQIPLTSE